MTKFYAMRKIFYLLVLALFFINLPKATAALSQGDLAVIGMNSDAGPSTTTRNFAVVALSTIAQNEEIYFTDLGWVNAFGSSQGHFVGALTFPTPSATTTNEGTFLWKPSSIIPAGTVIIFKIDLNARVVSAAKGDGTALPSTDLAILPGTWTNTNLSANPWPSTIGDQILIYQGTESNPSFIFAFNNIRSTATNVSNGWYINSSGTEPITTLPIYCELPGDLNSNCSLGFLTNQNTNDRYPNAIYYPAITDGSKESWLNDISNPAKWRNPTSGGTPYDFSLGFGSEKITFFNMEALPVSLIRYSVKAEGDAVKMQWSTATEKDNNHFQIERSKDAKIFEVIGIIEANGSSSVKRDYTWYDAQPYEGINYYRLVQVDYDGTTTRYGIRSLSFGLSTKIGVLVYPNPAVETVTVPLPEKTSVLKLLDVKGSVMRQLKIGENEGKVTVSVNDLLPGIYFIHLLTDAGTRSTKFVKF